MAHNNRTSKITHILVHALLEWTLIIFLLLNSLSSYLIIKFALYFRLKRPCLSCSRLQHRDLLLSKDLVCETHALEISKLASCSDLPNPPPETLVICDRCSFSCSQKNSPMRKMIQDDVDEMIESCENGSLLDFASHDEEVQKQGIEDGCNEGAVSELGLTVSSEDPFCGDDNLTTIEGRDEDLDYLIEQDNFQSNPSRFSESSSDESFGSEMETNDSIETLKWALRAEKKTVNALRVELEKERSASSFAADEMLAMIGRLQEEKAATQMAALQYRRMVEEQSEYEQMALKVLNEIMVLKEKSRRLG